MLPGLYRFLGCYEERINIWVNHLRAGHFAGGEYPPNSSISNNIRMNHLSILSMDSVGSNQLNMEKSTLFVGDSY